MHGQGAHLSNNTCCTQTPPCSPSGPSNAHTTLPLNSEHLIAPTSSLQISLPSARPHCLHPGPQPPLWRRRASWRSPLLCGSTRWCPHSRYACLRATPCCGPCRRWCTGRCCRHHVGWTACCCRCSGAWAGRRCCGWRGSSCCREGRRRSSPSAKDLVKQAPACHSSPTPGSEVHDSKAG